MTTEPIFGSARLTEAEVREALASSPFMRYRWLTLLLSATLTAVMVFRDGGIRVDRWPDILVIGLVFAVLSATVLLAPRTQARKMLKEMDANRGEADYRFDADGITIRAPGTSSSVSWRIITSYRETPHTFLVYTSPNLANIVPKRAFNAADVDAVRALLAASVFPVGRSKEGRR